MLSPTAMRLHTLKNCATTIYALSRLIAMCEGVDRAHAAWLNDAAQRMKDVLCASLDANEVDAATSVDVAEVIIRVSRQAQATAGDAGVNLAISYTPAPLHGCVDALAEASLNLVPNAIEATRSGSNVRFEHVVHDNGEHELVVSDTGIGMPRDVLANAGRKPGITHKCGGTGLGIAMALKVITEHGGRLSFESAPGERTTVRARIPH